MNVKAVLTLCLICSVFASTIATIAIAFGAKAPYVPDIAEAVTYNIESGQYHPTGDPIGTDFPPG